MSLARYPLVVYLTIAFSLGITLAFKGSTLLTILVILLVILPLWLIFRNKAIVASIVIFLLLGLLLGSFQKMLQSKNPFKRYYGQNVSVEGLVVSDVIKKNRLYGFTLRAQKLESERINVEVKAYSSVTHIKMGDYIKLKGLVKPPLVNFSSSPQAAIFSEGDVSHSDGNSFWLAIGKVRRWVKHSLIDGKSQARAFLYAMLTGQTNQLSEQTKGDLRASGLAHLWAVSGLHTGFIALLVLFLFRLVGLKAGWQLIFLALSLYLFAAFTGFKPPVIRASLMAGWLSAAYLLGRKNSWLAALSSAALISLFINPAALFDPSFQLSFAAVISIFAFHGKIAAMIEGIPLKLKQLLSVSISVQILILPLLAYYFGEIPVFAVLANMFVIPVAAMAFYLTIFGLMLKAVGIPILLSLPTLLSAYILEIAAFFNSFSLSTLVMTSLSVTLLLVTLLALAFIFQKKGRSLKFSSLIIFILAFISIQLWWPAADTVIAGKKLTVEFLDVGQGDASLVTGPEQQRILIDGGPKPYIIQKSLMKRRVKSLDLVIPSHADADHIAGLPTVLRNFKVKAVLDNGFPKASFLYRDFLKVIRLKKIRYILARRGQVVTVGSLKFQVLNPPEGFIKGTVSDDNNNSIVLRTNYLNTSFLFTGDLAFEGERGLMKQGSLRATVLKVGHHGSAYSTSTQFLKEVRPVVTVISAGAGNQYGHPRPSLLRRLALARVKIYRTDLSTDIKIVVNKGGLRVYDYD